MIIKDRITYVVFFFALPFMIVLSCKEKKTSSVSMSKEVEKVVSRILSNEIIPAELDETLLSELICARVNGLRKDYNLKPLKLNESLKQAAVDHNNYITSIGKLTHNGNSEKSYDVRTRVEKYESTFRILAENVLMRQYFVNTTTGQEVIKDNDYKSVADQLFEMWKNSEGHYKNIMRNDIEYVGTAVRWNNSQNAIYATQVFGG